MKDITGKLLDWEPLVKKINGRAIVMSTAMGSGDFSPDAVWAGEVLTDMTRELVKKYENITEELKE